MTEQTDDRNILRIPSFNLNKFKDLLAKLNRRGAKIGTPEITYDVLTEEHIVDPRFINPVNQLSANMDRLPKIAIYTIEIHGEGPKIKGWKFLGTFDHISIPGSVIVKSVPGETIPTEFHNCEPICDHCGTERRRNETFLLQEETTGDYKLIGRQCIRDFIGYDTKTIFNYLTYFNKLVEEFSEEDDWFGDMGTRFYTIDGDEVLRATAAIISKHGWISRSKADYDQIPTAGLVSDVFFPPNFDSSSYAEWQRWVESLDLDNEKWTKEAAGAREWLLTQEDNNDYMHNLFVLNGAKEIPVHMFGYWCSLVSAYQRAMDRLREQKKQKKLNEWVGEIKVRQDFNVKVVSIRSYEGRYGYTYQHRFFDEDGRTIIWWASNESDMEVDEEYTITGTVKKHDEFNNWKQTIITRVKVKNSCTS